MKKILFVATTAKKHLNLFHLPVIKRLSEMGYIVDAATNGDEKVPYVNKEFSVPFKRNPFKIENIKAIKNLEEIIKNENYDLISCHTPVGGMAARLASRGTNSKVMYTAHGFHFYEGGNIFRNFVFRTAEKFLAHFTDCLITINSEDYFEAQQFNLKKGGTVHFVNGVGIDTEKIINTKIDKNQKKEEIGVPVNNKILLMTGEFIKRKNHKTALKAFAMSAHSQLEMVLCGTGALENELKEYAKTLGVENKVHFLGFRRDAKDIAKASDIFIFTSFQEGLPASIIEAMSAGLPVIASEIRGNRDLIDDSFGGFLFEPQAAKDYADAINLLLKSPELCKKMGKYNINKANNYDIKQILSETINIYEHLLK